MAKKNFGKIFENSIEQATKDLSIFYFRVRDVNPMAIKPGQKVPQNKYDCLLFYKGYLFPLEMKSTQSKSLSFSEGTVKAHQIKSLKESNEYDKVIPGFLINFREPEDNTYFVGIDEYIEYRNIAENEITEHTYKSRVNKASIPIGICEEIGVKITAVKKKVNYRYHINLLLDELIEKYS